MDSPPFLRLILLIGLIAAAGYFALGGQLPSSVSTSAPFSSISNGVPQAQLLPDPPPAPPAQMGAASCRSFAPNAQWIASLLYVGSHDDGDTFSTPCTDITGERVRIRLANVNTADRHDCPEMREIARDRALEIIVGTRPHSAQPFWLYPIDVDRYGRVVAHVALPNGVLLGELLLREGLAEPAPGGQVRPYSC